jgi:hypothetical protein
MGIPFEPLLHQLEYFGGLLFASALSSFIWSSIWCSSLDDLVFPLLEHGDLLRKEVISEVAIGWFVLVITLILCLVLYFMSRSLKLQMFFFIVFLAGYFAFWALLGITTVHASPAKRIVMKSSFLVLAQSRRRPKAVSDWMTDKKCFDAATCDDAIDRYLKTRIETGFQANLVCFAMMALNFFGLWFIIFLMTFVRPVHEPEDQFEVASE